MCREVTCILMLLTVSTLQAQPPISLDSIVRAAIRYQPIIKQKQSGVSAAEAGLTATRHDFLPQVRVSEQLNAGTDNSLAGSYFTFGITPSTSAGVRGENNSTLESGNVATLYGEYQLYNFGLNKARLNASHTDIAMQSADLDNERYQLALQVARYYFATLKIQYRLDADRQNVFRYDSVFTVIRALASAGIRPGSDSSMAKAELSKARVDYNRTLGDLMQLKEELGYLTGLAPDVITADTVSLHLLLEQIPADTAMDPASIPPINYFISKRNVYLANDQVIRKAFMPKVMLVASAWGRGSSIQYSDNYKSLASGWGYQRFNYLAGIALTYNLFNGLLKRDQLVINHYRLEASDYALQQQTLAMRLASRNADHALKTATDNYREIPVQLESATAAYRQKLAQYTAGLISLIDLTNASFVLYRSQVDYSEGLADLLRAKLDKAAATGHLDSFIQTFK